uniref:hypothetical protein n=1 Tax=Blastomonas sp. TaxID=1909299 RepID=UPI0035933F68
MFGRPSDRVADLERHRIEATQLAINYEIERWTISQEFRGGSSAASSQKQPSAPISLNDLLWVGSRHGSDRAANGGFAPLSKNSCGSANDPEAAYMNVSGSA